MTWLTLSMEAVVSVYRPYGQPIYRRKCGNIGWNMKQVLFDIVMKSHFWNMMFQQHNKDRNLSRKCTTSLIHRQSHNGEVLDRNWLCFSPSQTCVKCFSCRLMSADTRLNVRISLLEKESSTGSTFLSAWGAMSNRWNIKMPRLHLVADVINHYEELI